MDDVCNCGMERWPEGVRTWTAEWHRMHKAHHLATFPGLADYDPGTVDNLDMCIRIAEEREATA